MSGPIGSSQWMYSSAAGFYPYSIGQSLRFNDDDSAYLSRTPSSAGNRKTWTWSGWVKRSDIVSTSSKAYILFDASTADTNASLIEFGMSTEGDTALNVVDYQSAEKIRLRTSMKFRDVSAFYHIVVAVDTTQSTSTDRVKIYVNGEQITSLEQTTYPSQNHDTLVNATNEHRIGKWHSSTRYFDGYMAEVNFIDGTALSPTSFGETINGVWVPKAYSGSYGTNGFYLPFDDSSAIGDDESGNTNDWTANNLAASDVVLDSPTNDFPVLLPGFTQTTQEGGLKLKRSSSGNIHTGCFSTMGVSSGKWYVEIKYEDSGIDTVTFGVAETEGGFDPAVDGTAYVETSGISSNTHMEFATWSVEARLSSSYAGTLGSAGSYGSSPSSGDIIQIALDMDDKKIWYGVNGTYIASGDPANGTNASQSGSAFNPTGEVVFVASAYMGRDFSISFNFGQDSANVSSANTDENGIGTFEYAPPSGFLALCSANLPEPTISPNAAEQADDYFNTVLWSGNSTNNRSITTDHATDFVWIKKRGTTVQSHVLADSVRGTSDNGGTGNVGILSSNLTDAESTNSSDSGIASFDSTGFTIGAGSNTANADAPYQGTNASGHTYVGWSWKAGGTAVSNTDGSITSSVSAAPDAGFSVVTYTGAGGVSTIGHGLSQPLDVFIVKNRGATSDWEMFHSALGNTARIELQSAAAQVTGINGWNSTSPTGTVFTVNGGAAGNTSGNTHLAYCFHSVDGYSKFSSYVGNGSSDGTFVYTGFRPSFLLWKNASATTVWVIFDAVRNTFNYADLQLRPNENTAEIDGGASYGIDLLSNGFKVRSSDSNFNGSGNTIIYLAFAEAPFKYANAR